MRHLASHAIRRGLLTALPLLALCLAWFVLLRPSFLGGPVSYVMVSGDSMEPTLSSGDLVVARDEDAYEVGDLVAFRVPRGEHGEGAIVIHRIAGGSAADGFSTQGDNNGWLDPWLVEADDIVGGSWLTVAGAGRWLNALKTPALLAGLVGGMVVSLVLVGERGKRRTGEKAKRGPPREAATPPTPLRKRATAWTPLRLTMWILLTALVVRKAASVKARR
jgi:signal peptidase